MNGWILYSRKDYEKNQWLVSHMQACLREKQISLECIFEEDCTDLEKMLKEHPCDFVISRIRHWQLLAFLEERKIRVFNSSRINELANNKWKALQYAASQGIAIPESRLVHSLSDLKDWSFPCVLKTLDGHGGTEVCWIADEEQMQKHFQTMPEKGLLAQSPVSELGTDIRVYILKNRISVMMKRHSDTDFRSNYSLSHQAEEYADTDGALTHLVSLFLQSCSIDYAGIDFMYDHGHPVFNELEDPVGSRMVYDRTGRDLIREFAEQISSQLQD